MKRNGTIDVSFIQVDKLQFFKAGIFLLHLVGMFGLSMEFSRPLFKALTPFHLVSCTVLLLLTHRKWNKDFLVFSLLVFSLGIFIEIIGVQTGWIFGEYTYGTNLGPQIMGVPLIIGINWFLLVYTTAIYLAGKITNGWLAAFTGAGLMMVMDIFIEPVAIKLDFWVWKSSIIPFSNYIAWFAIGFILHTIFRRMNFEKENPLAGFLLLNIFVFFAVLSLIL